ncbi:unnamed protein product [Oreochromis niloticus]|nr:unnamed protein product [Mustela putorius furo]
MGSFKVLLRALTLTLLGVTVDSSSGGYSNYNYEMSGQKLTDLYNSPVYKAEWMVRPFGSSSSTFGPVSHTGVRVTLADDSQWLIHKGQGYGISSETVVTSAQHMSSDWKVSNFVRCCEDRFVNGYKSKSRQSGPFIESGSPYLEFSKCCVLVFPVSMQLQEVFL